ncbi:FAD-dependent oxidoreductase [Streptomyces griseus]|uniref:FAD-dependent oxidoreductase n=1 Tax=Streptomyces griseus TaxID=1911 RepID=UPI00068C37FC|nr:FAD-dependent oxidoreductase [Streptomyces griseus]
MTRAGPPRDHYDVVVAGGGPAGCAAALTLIAAGRTVLLADSATGPPKTGEALVPVARLLLSDLHVADTALTTGHLPCHGTHSAWGSTALHTVDFIRDPYGHGWHLDRPLFDRALRAAARAAGADVAEHTAVRRPERHHDGTWRLTLRTARAAPRTVTCHWIVDATGRRAAIAVAAGARRQVEDRLTAHHLTLDPLPGATDGHSLVESAPDGWWYTTLLPSRRRLVAYFTDPDLFTPADFRNRLLATRHVARTARPHGVGTLGPPRRAPAHSAHLDRVHGDGWVASGDAAVAFDPLSSQGILTALCTGLGAGRAVHAHLRGAPGALDDYTADIATARAAYQHAHRTAHARETRWPDRPFWWRRRATAAPGTGDGPRTLPPPSAGSQQRVLE